MCQGYIEDGRPWMDIVLAKGSRDNVKVKFLLDTGADKTAITLKDAIRLVGLDVSEIVNPDNRISGNGVGGKVRVYPIFDTIGFAFIDSSVHTNKLSYHIEFLESMNLIPTLTMSILGRDLLDRFDIEITTVPKKVELKRNDFGGGTHLCLSL